MHQRTNTNNDNRKHIVLQNHYFTFQRQYNTHNLELQIQVMQLQIEQMQAQINSMSSGGDPGGGGGEIGVSQYLIKNKTFTIYYVYKYVGTNICIYHLRYLTLPQEDTFFKTPP